MTRDGRNAERSNEPRCTEAAAQRGFTLVELMVVVAIVGILALLGIVAYRKLVRSSHTAEATSMVQAIRSAQEAYHAETQQYANISPNLDTTYPAAAPGRFKTGWGAACGSQCNSAPSGPANGWLDLPVHVDGPVMFGYATTAGAAGSRPTPTSITVNNQTVTLPTSTPVDWFVIGAKGDQDGNGVFCRVYGTSWTNDVWVDLDGE